MDAKTFAVTMARLNGGSMTVQTRSDSAAAGPASGAWYEYRAGDEPNHHLRMVFGNEIVFDVGDCNDRECGARHHVPCWPTCVRRTHALWMALNRLGIPHWAALSGGKGTHTHVFGPPRAPSGPPHCGNCLHGQHGVRCGAELLAGTCRCFKFEAVSEGGDWRNAVSGVIVEAALGILGNPLDQDFCDYRLLAPTRHMVREFGCRKTPASAHMKMLWHIGPGPFLPLPASRNAAYRAALSVFPGEGPAVADWLDGLARTGYGAISGGPCPQGPQCVPAHPVAKLEPFGRCAGCPLDGD